MAKFFTIKLYIYAISISFLNNNIFAELALNIDATEYSENWLYKSILRFVCVVDISKSYISS
jgi:hypothetical protein